MASLDMKARTRIGAELESRLPEHWRVTVGADGYAFVEIDQDGKKPAHERHALGSSVIRVVNGDKGLVIAARFRRIKHPPGYLEGRECVADVAEVRGRGWLDELVELVAVAAMEADAQLSGATTAEA